MLAVAGVLLGACTSGTGDRGVPAAGSGGIPPTTEDAAPSWVVTVGDSYISGEGARWAGNTTLRARPVDALGPDAYFDRPGGERQPGCHRASESIATLDQPGVRGRNLACSGATTRSSGGAGQRFKPGLDFYRDREGNLGQALALERFARTHDVSHVVVSIGGNDFRFGPIVSRCAIGFLGITVERSVCSDDVGVTATFSSANARAVTREIRGALDRVALAMQRAGYADAQYTMVVLTYPSPMPDSSEVRYARDQARFEAGGCPFFDADLDFANDVALPTINASVAEAAGSVRGPDVVRLDLAGALDGHRLCETGVATFPASNVSSWEARGAAERLEWVNRVYFTFAPWAVAESLHPNYWGMKAEQDCVRLVVSGVDEGRQTCVPTDGLTADGSPAMRLVAR